MSQPEKTTHAVMNGVDLSALNSTIRAVQDDPTLGAFQFRNQNKWLDGGHNQSTIQGFYGCGEEDKSRTTPFTMDADEPPVLLGRDLGANPVEFVLHALIGCMTTSMVYHAAARGIEIADIQSELEGDLDLRGFLGLSADIPKGYSQIRVRMHVKSEAAEAVLRECLGFSPVFEMMSNAVDVKVDLVLSE